MPLGIRSRIAQSIGAQLFTGFGLTVMLALLVALISLTATRDATARLASLQETQQQMIAAIKELEVGTELQSNAVQAYILSDDERFLQDRAAGQARFADAFNTLLDQTLASEGLDRLDAVEQARAQFEASAASQLALYQQGWRRSLNFLWRTEGQGSKRQLERQIDGYRAWYEAAILDDIEAAHQRGKLALGTSIGLITLAAAAGLFIGIRMSRSITGRLSTLGAAARSIEGDDFSARATISGSDEVAALGTAMNRMAEHLEESQRALEESRRKLAESLEQYRLLAENALDIVFTVDRAGRFTYINLPVEHVTGYKPDELIGRVFIDFLSEDIRAARWEAFERRIQGQDVGSTAEIDFLARDGRPVPLELRISTIEQDGQVLGIQSIARDITRRKAMEAQVRRLAEQEHRRAEQLQEVARAGRKFGRLSSLAELLPNVVNLLHESFGYERAALFLVDPGAQLASLRACAGDFAAAVPLSFSLSANEGLVGWVATHGEPLRVSDVSSEPRYVEIPATRGTRSELVVPIRAAGQVLGALDVQSNEPDHFDANDEAALMILAESIGIAIQNAEQFEQQHSLAVAEERNRLAREIHDTLAQGLTAITLQLEVADAMLDLDAEPEQARAKIAKALDLTRANLEEARRSVLDLRAAPLQERTLPAALEDLVATFARDNHLRADFGAREVGGRLPAAMEAGLYRIAQEALNNVARHADATTVHLTLAREDGSLVLCVEDNGTGFDPTAPPPDRRRGGFGLLGMQERARLLGGQLEVNSTPNAGTRIVVRVPAPTRRGVARQAAGKVPA